MRASVSGSDVSVSERLARRGRKDGVIKPGHVSVRGVSVLQFANKGEESLNPECAGHSLYRVGLIRVRPRMHTLASYANRTKTSLKKSPLSRVPKLERKEHTTEHEK